MKMIINPIMPTLLFLYLYWNDLLSLIFNVLAHKSNSLQEDVLFYPDTLFGLRTDQSLLLLLTAACLAEKQHIPV